MSMDSPVAVHIRACNAVTIFSVCFQAVLILLPVIACHVELTRFARNMRVGLSVFAWTATHKWMDADVSVSRERSGIQTHFIPVVSPEYLRCTVDTILSFFPMFLFNEYKHFQNFYFLFITVI